MHRFLSLGLAIVAATMFTGADWLQFRSADTTGIAQGPTPPVSWSEDENVAWKAELPGRGLSGAIVIGDRVIVTASSGFEQDRLHVLCFSDKTGEKLWEFQTGSGIIGQPVTWEEDGRQYVSVASGSGGAYSIYWPLLGAAYKDMNAVLSGVPPGGSVWTFAIFDQ